VLHAAACAGIATPGSRGSPTGRLGPRDRPRIHHGLYLAILGVQQDALRAPSCHGPGLVLLWWYLRGALRCCG
ncbi:unnamed protein product, partial [Symbiodinium necroappetens]